VIDVVRRLAVDTMSKVGRLPAGALFIQSTCDHDGVVLALVVTSPDANDDHDTEHTGANDCAELSATNSERTSITQSFVDLLRDCLPYMVHPKSKSNDPSHNTPHHTHTPNPQTIR
jgi:hypothetical protein